MSIETTLADLGLSKNKGSVYLALLSLGSGSAEQVGKQAGLPRTTTHEILQQLVGLGVASFVTKGRSRTYSAERPDKLKNILQDKERSLLKILPELTALLNTSGVKPTIRFYEGVHGVKSILEDTLTVSDKVLRGILSMEDLYEIPGKSYMDDYVARRIAAGVKLKVIRSSRKDVEEIWPFSMAEQRELHYAPDGMLFPMTMYLYDNKVGIIATKRENFGLLIESADLFLTLKNFWEVLWQVTRVGKKKI